MEKDNKITKNKSFACFFHIMNQNAKTFENHCIWRKERNSWETYIMYVLSFFGTKTLKRVNTSYVEKPNTISENMLFPAHPKNVYNEYQNAKTPQK